MRIVRLSLTNFRVFPEVDLELPPGVVGVYGPNGSGKSTLVEAILWALFGVARTAKESLRRDGADGECRATVTFEHDGHLYEVTRAVNGASHAVRAEAFYDGQRLAAGAIAVRQYVHQVLGMSADAFRSSVFCEQKQVDAFSARRPEDRRRLVLDLLGITPLDRARDAARSRARANLERLEAARLVLGDLDALTAEAAALAEEVGHAEAARLAAEERLAAAEQAEAAAETEASSQERRKLERDRLAAAWHEANRRAEDARRRLEGHEGELAELAAAAARLPELETQADRLASLRRRRAALEALAAARRRFELAGAAAAAAGGGEAGGPGLSALEEEATLAARRAGEAAGRVAGLEAALKSARTQRETAAKDVERARHLDPGAPCPLCGQELGSCFEDVLVQRNAALEQAETALARLEGELDLTRRETAEAERVVAAAEAARLAERTRAERNRAAHSEVAEAEERLREAEAGLDPPAQPDEEAALTSEMADVEAARDEAVRLRERLGRAEALRAAATEERGILDDAARTAQRLREEGRSLCFDQAAHAAAGAALRAAREALATARSERVETQLRERGLTERLDERRRRLDAELGRRDELASLEDDARHFGRLAELLGAFRNSLVGEVGPALSSQTTALFRELTDGRFERLDVDPETFELCVWAAGAGHALERHSGSETDLANLSLRIAIAEQVNLLSGGQVGLLVLDEVLGALDGEHRDRLLAALTRLAGRFRQVIVVTHAAEVKEQLPQAVEVIPVARGQSHARLNTAHLHLLQAG